MAQGAQPKLALVIDDVCGGTWAQSRPVIPLAKRIKMTVAMLPNGNEKCRDLFTRALPHSTILMLHMPMEPKGGEDPGAGALKIGMDESEIRERLDAALAEIPNALGMNNHMGSAVTEDAVMMGHVLNWARDEALFYLDSATGHLNACGLPEARAVPCARNIVFLDNDRNYGAIAKALHKARDIAKRTGQVVTVIGHPHKETLAVIEAFVRNNRAEFVPIVRSLPRMKRRAVPTPAEPSH